MRAKKCTKKCDAHLFRSQNRLNLLLFKIPCSCRRRQSCLHGLADIKCYHANFVDKPTIRFDGKRHRLHCSTVPMYRESNTHFSRFNDEALHYLKFFVLRAQGFSLHCKTAFLNFILDEPDERHSRKRALSI